MKSVLNFLVIISLAGLNFAYGSSETNWTCSQGSGFGAHFVEIEGSSFSQFYSHGPFGMITVIDGEFAKIEDCSGIVRCKSYTVGDTVFAIDIIPGRSEQSAVLVEGDFQTDGFVCTSR